MYGQRRRAEVGGGRGGQGGGCATGAEPVVVFPQHLVFRVVDEGRGWIVVLEIVVEATAAGGG